MKLSEKIVKLRKENGLSQEDLAQRLAVSRQAVSRWETGS
ncbi:MAG: helix-turn-helix transcriptional regulator, partial [Oscillospiraceae bacterium]|nr:helix-turn-helix transcriptional regulator [Oscillospiraceae bacterium]